MIEAPDSLEAHLSITTAYLVYELNRVLAITFTSVMPQKVKHLTGFQN